MGKTFLRLFLWMFVLTTSCKPRTSSLADEAAFLPPYPYNELENGLMPFKVVTSGWPTLASALHGTDVHYSTSGKRIIIFDTKTNILQWTTVDMPLDPALQHSFEGRILIRDRVHTLVHYREHGNFFVIVGSLYTYVFDGETMRYLRAFKQPIDCKACVVYLGGDMFTINGRLATFIPDLFWFHHPISFKDFEMTRPMVIRHCESTTPENVKFFLLQPNDVRMVSLINQEISAVVHRGALDISSIRFGTDTCVRSIEELRMAGRLSAELDRKAQFSDLSIIHNLGSNRKLYLANAGAFKLEQQGDNLVRSKDDKLEERMKSLLDSNLPEQLRAFQSTIHTFGPSFQLRSFDSGYYYSVQKGLGGSWTLAKINASCWQKGPASKCFKIINEDFCSKYKEKIDPDDIRWLNSRYMLVSDQNTKNVRIFDMTATPEDLGELGNFKADKLNEFASLITNKKGELNVHTYYFDVYNLQKVKIGSLFSYPRDIGFDRAILNGSRIFASNASYLLLEAVTPYKAPLLIHLPLTTDSTPFWRPEEMMEYEVMP